MMLFLLTFWIGSEASVSSVGNARVRSELPILSTIVIERWFNAATMSPPRTPESTPYSFQGTASYANSEGLSLGLKFVFLVFLNMGLDFWKYSSEKSRERRCSVYLLPSSTLGHEKELRRWLQCKQYDSILTKRCPGTLGFGNRASTLWASGSKTVGCSLIFEGTDGS